MAILYILGVENCSTLARSVAKEWTKAGVADLSHLNVIGKKKDILCRLFIILQLLLGILKIFESSEKVVPHNLLSIEESRKDSKKKQNFLMKKPTNIEQL